MECKVIPADSDSSRSNNADSALSVRQPPIQADFQAAVNALIDVFCLSGDLLDQSDLAVVLNLTRHLQRRRHVVQKREEWQERRRIQLLQLQQGYALIAPKPISESTIL